MKKTLVLVLPLLVVMLAVPIIVQHVDRRNTVSAAAPLVQPTPPIDLKPLLEVAKVFGRAQGCADADVQLIQMTAKSAMDARLDPAIAAATVATESGCNGFAVSSRGAIGLMQVMPKIWKDKYDFTGSVNLLNEQDNVRVGAEIMEGLIKQYGLTNGIQRYNGVGVGCPTCDGSYAAKILALAHK